MATTVLPPLPLNTHCDVGVCYWTPFVPLAQGHLVPYSQFGSIQDSGPESVWLSVPLGSGLRGTVDVAIRTSLLEFERVGSVLVDCV